MAEHEGRGREALARLLYVLNEAETGAMTWDELLAVDGEQTDMVVHYRAVADVVLERFKAHDAEVAATALRKWTEHPGMAVGSWHPGPAALCDPFCAHSLGSTADQVRARDDAAQPGRRAQRDDTWNFFQRALRAQTTSEFKAMVSDWLKAHDAEVAAEALREAADDADRRADERPSPTSLPAQRLRQTAAWLRTRADTHGDLR